MFFLEEAVCGLEISAVLKVIYFIKELLRIVCIIVPILLIVMLFVDFIKNVIASGEDDMKKNLNLVIKRIIMSMGLFLLPTIISFSFTLLGDIGVPYAKCLEDANLDNIARIEEIEEANKANSDNTTNNSNVTELKGNSGLKVVNTSAGSYKIYTSDKIKLNKTLKYLKYENTYQLKLSGDYDKTKTITWTSSNKNIASVDSDGLVKATGGGIAVITASVDGEKVSCKVIAIRVSLKVLGGEYRTTATVYYSGNKKLTYYYRTQGYSTACKSEKYKGKEICNSGFMEWYANHGCVTTSVTAVVNAYKGNTKENLISAAKMRMVYEKNEYNWSCSSSDPYCNLKCFQLTRKRVEAVLNNQFNLSAKAYTLKKDKSDQEEHIERIQNAIGEGRPVIFFVSHGQAKDTKYTSQVHGLTMVSFYDEEGHVLVMDSSHNGVTSDTLEVLVKKYITRGTGNYAGYIVLNNLKG